MEIERELIKSAADSIEKGSLISMDGYSISDVKEWVTSGCWVLDKITGGGIPVGRIVEIFGNEATGKSSLGFSILGEFQKRNYITIMIDTETSYDTNRVKVFGVDPKRVLYSQLQTIEGVFTLMETLMEKTRKQKNKKKKKLLILWDSIPATSVKEELEGEFGNRYYGIHANMIAQGFRKIKRYLTWEGVTLVLINQERPNIGVMFGPKYTTFGGKAVPFYASIRIRLSSVDKIEENKKIIGIRVKAMTVKNKVFPPFRSCNFILNFNTGFDNISSSIDYLVEQGSLEKKLGWITYKGKKYRNNEMQKYFKEHTDQLLLLIGRNL